MENEVIFKETKEAVIAAMSLYTYVDENLSDGFQPVEDGLAAYQIFPEVMKGIQGIDKVPSEYINANEAQAKEFQEWFQNYFDIKQDKVEAWIEWALEVVDNMYQSLKKRKLLPALA